MAGMGDIWLTLRTQYQSVLDGNLSHSAAMYDDVPMSVAPPYVVYTGFTDTEDPDDKTEYKHNVTVTLTVVTKFRNEGGQKISDEIADDILGLIRIRNADGFMNLGPNFYMITQTLESTTATKEVRQDGTLYYRTLTFRHLIGEN